METSDLVEVAKNGDKDAFERLVLKYQDVLYKIAKVKMNNEDDICEVVQETILAAYKHISKLRDNTYFKTWLIKILINKCNDYYKRPYKNDVSLDSFEYDNLSNSKELNSEINFERVISELDQDEKTIMVLHYSEGYKEKEIAEILNMNYGSLRTKMKRAKEKLLKKLEKEGL